MDNGRNTHALRKRSHLRQVLGVSILGIAVVSGCFYWWQQQLEKRVDLSRKLVGRWATDDPVNALETQEEPSLSGAVKWVEGRLSFAGTTGKAIVPHSARINVGAGDLSMMAWIQPERTQTSFGVMSIIEKRKVGGLLTARGFSLHLEYGKLACQLSPAPGLNISRSNLLSPSSWLNLWKQRNAFVPARRFISQGPDLRDGMAHHVALSLDRNSPTGGKLYVDGKLVLNFNPASARGNLATTEPLLIGTHPDRTLNCAFKGTIHDVRLYRRALSDAEIKAAAEME